MALNADAKLCIIFIMTAIAVSYSSFGQTSSVFEPLSIDRPDVSNLPMTVLPGQLQFEMGVESARGPLSEEFYIPNLTFRTGINKKLELRLGSMNFFSIR